MTPLAINDMSPIDLSSNLICHTLIIQSCCYGLANLHENGPFIKTPNEKQPKRFSLSSKNKGLKSPSKCRKIVVNINSLAFFVN